MARKGQSYLSRYMGKFWVYLFLSILFVVNITALSISLQCNRDAPFFMRILSAYSILFWVIIYITKLLWL